MQYSEEPYEDEFVDGDLPTSFNRSTGGDGFDPQADDDYYEDGRSESTPSVVQEYKYNIPDVIRNFITYFLRQVKEQNVYEIHNLYENSFTKLTEKYYKTTPWPSAEAIKSLVDPERDALFMTLYKELYFRHLYTKMTPTLDQRIESWNNYVVLFDFLLSATSPSEVELQLPNQWLWDITDEFIYQFQAFSQYRSKLKNKSQEELATLRANPDVWNVGGVLGYLSALVAKSGIVATLEREKGGMRRGQDDQSSGEFSSHPLYKILGYFSIIGQLRIHCLLGDYYLALKTLEPIDLNKKGLYTRVTACHMTLYYYLGFSYMMMRRYVDAIKSFSNMLLYINRTKQYYTRSTQYEQLVKKHDQMYALLAIAVCLSPQRIDENVHAVLREKHGDKMQRMQRGEEAVFDELFAFACPKFVLPAAPNYDDEPHNYNQDAYNLQLKLFQMDVRQQIQLPIIRSFLKLYSTISTEKLASFLDMSDDNLRTNLLCFKHKTRNLVWSGGNPLNGKPATSSDVDFYIEQNMVHIIDSKVTRRYGEYFIRHINKFEDIIKDLSGR